jgi:hypothetical protein
MSWTIDVYLVQFIRIVLVVATIVVIRVHVGVFGWFAHHHQHYSPGSRRQFQLA